MKEHVLKQLLEELLSSADESAPIGHGLSAEDLDINKQVIELVVNAGLMVLIQHRSVAGSDCPLFDICVPAEYSRFGKSRYALSRGNTDHRTKSTRSTGSRNEGHDNRRLVSGEVVCCVGTDKGRRAQAGDHINIGGGIEDVERGKSKILERSAEVYRNDKVVRFTLSLPSTLLMFSDSPGLGYGRVDEIHLEKFILHLTPNERCI